MILITSGAYLQGEFSTEVGILPPSFLPIGNKRLYEYQIDFFKDLLRYKEDIFLSVPSSFELSVFDKKNLRNIGVNIIFAPDHLTLASSILYSWNASGKSYKTLSILHGDTLFLDFQTSSGNILSVHPNRGFHRRAKLETKTKLFVSASDEWSNNKDLVFSGFFSFQNPLYFMKCLVESENNFTNAVNKYHEKFNFKLNSSGQWLDFGHINNFYQARSQLTTQRVFNNLYIDKNTVTKTSKKHPLKIYSEGSWFSQIPLELRLHTPTLLMFSKNKSTSSYTIEYLYCLPLSDLLVFTRLPYSSWTLVFENIFTVLSKFDKYKPPMTEVAQLLAMGTYLSKTLNRLSEYQKQSGTTISSQKFKLINDSEAYTLEQVAVHSSKYINVLLASDLSVIHGDLCFSNILYDSRSELIKCVDPRGLTLDNKISLYGDRRYDLAKLYHSIIGKYDFIIANHYKLDIEVISGIEQFEFELLIDNDMNDIEGLFRKLILSKLKYSEKEVLAITIHLFLSMLPLHFDNPTRQKAFIANALRLYKMLRTL